MFGSSKPLHPLDPPFDEKATATIRYGVYMQPGAYVGKTISQIRQIFGSIWNIDPDADVYCDKAKLDDTYVIQAGDLIEFVRKLRTRALSTSSLPAPPMSTGSFSDVTSYVQAKEDFPL